MSFAVQSYSTCSPIRSDKTYGQYGQGCFLNGVHHLFCTLYIIAAWHTGGVRKTAAQGHNARSIKRKRGLDSYRLGGQCPSVPPLPLVPSQSMSRLLEERPDPFSQDPPPSPQDHTSKYYKEAMHLRGAIDKPSPQRQATRPLRPPRRERDRVRRSRRSHGRCTRFGSRESPSRGFWAGGQAARAPLEIITGGGHT